MKKAESGMLYMKRLNWIFYAGYVKAKSGMLYTAVWEIRHTSMP
jgi:hypothetical protein